MAAGSQPLLPPPRSSHSPALLFGKFRPFPANICLPYRSQTPGKRSVFAEKRRSVADLILKDASHFKNQSLSQHKFYSDTDDLKGFRPSQGKSTVNFSLKDQLLLVKKLSFVLVGKFSHGRPSMAAIKEAFARLPLQGKVNVASADSKHIFIECSCEADFYGLWLKLVLKIKGFVMRLFKWDCDFSPGIESPIAPVWIRFEGLPLYLFDELPLLKIANSIGKPICIDERNLNRSVLGSARICVELDVSKPPLDLISILIEDDELVSVVHSFKVEVHYDVLPSYCSNCSHIGHRLVSCKVGKSVKADSTAVEQAGKLTAANNLGHCGGLDDLSPSVQDVLPLKPSVSLPAAVHRWQTVGRKHKIKGKQALNEHTGEANSFNSYELTEQFTGSEAMQLSTIKTVASCSKNETGKQGVCAKSTG